MRTRRPAFSSINETEAISAHSDVAPAVYGACLGGAADLLRTAADGFEATLQPWRARALKAFSLAGDQP